MRVGREADRSLGGSAGLGCHWLKHQEGPGLAGRGTTLEDVDLVRVGVWTEDLEAAR